MPTNPACDSTSIPIPFSSKWASRVTHHTKHAPGAEGQPFSLDIIHFSANYVVKHKKKETDLINDQNTKFVVVTFDP
jgi:hypothetical protein